jgi:hypothetical protein
LMPRSIKVEELSAHTFIGPLHYTIRRWYARHRFIPRSRAVAKLRAGLVR